MKLKLDIDVSPEEARQFFGLPEVKPLQDKLMADLEKRLREGMAGMDMQTLLKTWMPSGVPPFDQWKAFWGKFTGGGQKGE